MKTNFDFLTKEKIYDSFSHQAIEAERALLVSPATCAILSRRALELAVRFVYSYDNELKIPYQDNLSSLVHASSFQNIIEPRLFPMIKFVIKLGNVAVHTNSNIKRDDAILSLRNLFEFCDWVDYCYSETYCDKQFDESILENSQQERKRPEELRDLYEKLSSKDRKIEEIRKENEELRNRITQARVDNVKARNFTVDELSEAQTRNKYIDVELQEAGWSIGKDCLTEVQVTGMPNPTGIGYVDYVLYGKDSLPLAIVEAKKCSVDSNVGSHQAKLYADCIQNQYGRRPLIFLTNGFEVFYINDFVGYPKRQVSGFFTQDELQLEIDRRQQRIPLEKITIKDEITNRPYQKEAVTAVCDAIMHNHRKTLIVQATGSGKTRVSISIVDVLRRHNYVKNILFLADRKALVKQAKKNYTNLLSDLSCCNLLDSKDDPEQCRMIFSTYPTMMNAIDEQRNKDGRRLFTPAHFDLIIVDESHRSIYKKYQEIFTYFDAILLGMTATPKNEIDKNTYAIFDLERGVPTFAYELEKAVEEGYLVNYSTLEYKSKIMEDGIHYNDLSEEEKEEFEEKFGDDDSIGEDISSEAVNTWLFNADTIDMVLRELMEKGLKVEGGDKLGKTIIFAKNSLHAKAIVDRFRVIFPEYGGDFIEQIDYSIKFADDLIDRYSTKEKMPQIAVSVDMLDTGIDVPEILNLVFFKKVRSYSKFWQMIGRGTRLCKDLLGVGQDKNKFLIFDFCNNFEFFRVNKNGEETGIQESLSEKIFNVKVNIVRELQDSRYVNEQEYVFYRNDLVKELQKTVMDFDESSFRVKHHIRYVEKYKEIHSWDNLESIGVSELREHIAPLTIPKAEDELARRFDYLMYNISLEILQSKNVKQPVKIVISTAEQLSRKYSIPQVAVQQETIEKVVTPQFWEKTNIHELNSVRLDLRDLLRYLDKEKDQKIYYTNFTDTITDMAEGEPIFGENDLKNYKKKVEYYLKQNMNNENNLAVYKLRKNRKLTESDFHELERILWNELGSKEDYEKEYADTPVGKLVRRIVGLDRESAEEAFSEFIDDEQLNVNQIRFVRLIIDYIVANGNIEDNRVLQEEPFRSVGSIMVVFQNDMDKAKKLLEIVADIKNNSEVIA